MIEHGDSLERFLRTGRLGPLRCGMIKDEVAAALGRPDAEYPNPRIGVERWIYGKLEVVFDPDEIHMIEVDVHKHKLDVPSEVGAAWHRSLERTTLSQFVEFLKERGLRCKKRVWCDASVTVVISLEAGHFDIPFGRMGVHHVIYVESPPSNYRLVDCW